MSATHGLVASAPEEGGEYLAIPTGKRLDQGSALCGHLIPKLSNSRWIVNQIGLQPQEPQAQDVVGFVTRCHVPS